MNAAQLPSLQGLARNIVEALRQDQIVLMGFPSAATRERWLGLILLAIDEYLAVRGEQWPSQRLAVNSTADPQSVFFAHMGLQGESDLAWALEAPSDAAPVVMEPAGPGLPEVWLAFLARVGRAQRVLGPGCTTTPLFVPYWGAADLGALARDVGCRTFALWNAVSWEEMRLAAAYMLPADTNPLARGWRVATYVAAANGDVASLESLCQQRPGTLAECLSAVLPTEAPLTAQAPASAPSQAVNPERWTVPHLLDQAWLTGAALGWTAERGIQRPWASCGERLRDEFALAAWREQVSGLLPVVIEISRHAGDFLTQAVGSRWQQRLREFDRFARSPSAAEPATIMAIFSEYPTLGRIPGTLHDLFSTLRSVRNALAHLEPVDLAEFQRIWQLYGQAARAAMRQK